ncbi:hypothetical protein FOZ61_010865 [Perkinsus olseni]|uniref:Uncharacterized protein n=1 Tax=Perkinsus olseni TaxID=32597 RepID=A0A7J6KZD7_PEROL|nr:hypothetical protein FOZ61_010865 [Perkinsus olseni]KAF4652725.1 hypothetical protein FOL46_009541 [Perkinsus olseni]
MILTDLVTFLRLRRMWMKLRATFDQYKRVGASGEVAGVARDTARPSAVAHNETPMPERYDGVTNFEDWLRRYEADARGSGWTDPRMAERLGNHLCDVYFDVWHQHCTKKDFKADRLSFLAMLSPVRPDEILAKFNGMTWDRITRLVAFLDFSSPADTMDQMVMDRLIANSPDAAKPPSRPAAASQADATMGSDDGLGPPSSVVQALVGSLEKLFDQRERRLAAVTLPKKCLLCGGEHWLKDCPYKKFSAGCFVCGAKDHVAATLWPVVFDVGGSPWFYYW